MLASIFDVLVFLWRMSLRMMSSKRLVEKYSLTANMQTMQRRWLCMRGCYQTLPLPFTYPDALDLTTHIHNCTWRKNMRNQFVLFLSFVLFHFLFFQKKKQVTAGEVDTWWKELGKQVIFLVPLFFQFHVFPLFRREDHCLDVTNGNVEYCPHWPWVQQ